MKPVKLKEIQLYYKCDVVPEITFSNAHEAMFCLIYLKTGLIFIKPENENHILFPDNIREYQNLMQLLKSMDSVVDKSGKITADKSILRKNVTQFEHYFYDSWVKQNLTKSQQDDLRQFMNEPIESKNKLIYFKLMQYVEEVKRNMPTSMAEKTKESVDHYRITMDTPSYNVSLANVFEAMNQLDLLKGYKKMVGAIGVAYSITAFKLMYFSNNLHELYNGKIFEFSYVENRTYEFFRKSNENNRGIVLKLQNLRVKSSDKTVSLMELNKAIKGILADWEKESGNTIKTDNADEATKMAQIFSLTFAYLFIYNGYYAGVSDDGTTLGKKFYERAVYFKQGRYTLAPSGFFYKVLNLKRVIELTLLEKLDNSVEIDDNGNIAFTNKKVTDSNEDVEHWLLDKRLSKSKEQLLELKEIAQTDFDKDFIDAWIKLIAVNALDEEPVEILPYCSFEVLKFISDEQVRRSASKYRKGEQESIKRFTSADRSTTGFSNDYNRILLDLIEKMTFSLPCNSNSKDTLESHKLLKFDSPLSYYYAQFESIRSVFDLFKYYEFIIGDKMVEGEKTDQSEDIDYNIENFDERTTLKELSEKLTNFLKKYEKDKKFYPATKNELKKIRVQILQKLKNIKSLNKDNTIVMKELIEFEKLVNTFGNSEGASTALQAISKVLNRFESIVQLVERESKTTASEENSLIEE